MNQLKNWLLDLGISVYQVELAINAVEFSALIMLAIIANIVAKQYILATVKVFFRQTKNTWDDLLIEKNVFARLSHLAPALVVFFGIEWVISHEQIIDVIRRISNAYMIVVGASVISSILSVILEAYQRFDVSSRKPIKGYVQAIKLFVYLTAGLFVLSALMNKSPWGFLSVLGGLTAVLLLVFKDTILGLVASVQLIANNMIAKGDWIEMPKYGADGDVIDITLTTVKVQNWDKTISTIPTYALISDSFKNWRGMSDSDGRRIKRSIALDMNSVKFLDEELLKKCEKMEYLKEYLKYKKEEIDEHNRENGFDMTARVNGRRLTNLGTFRAYILEYLRQHPEINKDMTFLVRQLQPNEHGVPMEIYVFSGDKNWAIYESIQADILDHLLAVIPEFELKVFQRPSGADFKSNILYPSS